MTRSFSPFIFLLLTIIFLSQVYISVRKYLDGNISKSVGVTKKPEIHFPSITICPFPKIGPDQNPPQTSFSSVKENAAEISDYLYRVKFIESDMKEYFLTSSQAINKGLIRTTFSASMSPHYTKEIVKCFTFIGRKYPYKKGKLNTGIWVCILLGRKCDKIRD